MKTVIIALIALTSASTFAETLKVGIYSQVGSVVEFCHVNSGYIFVNGIKTANNADLGKIFKLSAPLNASLVFRDASIARQANECDKIVIEREDGTEVKASRIPGTINFEVNL